MPVLIWFRKSCVLELGKLVFIQEPANNDNLVKLGLLEWTVEKYGQESDKMPSVC